MIKTRFGPDGIHLFDNNTGTNILLDEIVLPKNIWTSSPRQVSIALTNVCDLNCTHCYAPKDLSKLDFDKLKKWIVELDKENCFGIGFGGGEPFLYPQIIELLEFCNQNSNLAISITSHGHLLNEVFIEKLQKSIHFIRISMDGVHNNYENIRGRKFSSLIEKIDLLKDKIPFGINYTVNNMTIDDLTCAAEIAEKYSATEMLLLPEEPIRRGKRVDKTTLNKLNNWIKSYNGKLRLSISSSHHKLVNSDLPLKNENDKIAFCHISADGLLKNNSFDFNGINIGNEGFMFAYRKLLERDWNYENME